MMSTPRERPILFSGPMVRAVLAGTKTQTRRVMDEPPDIWPTIGGWDGFWFPGGRSRRSIHYGSEALFRKGAPKDFSPFGQPGDRLWVRETWADLRGKGFDNQVGYRANTRPGSDADQTRIAYGVKWRPSIHMPRWASRITLEVTGVRVERLQEISRSDAIAEGIPPWPPMRCDDEGSLAANDETEEFSKFWDSFAKPDSCWDDNPWVWVIEFKRIQP